MTTPLFGRKDGTVRGKVGEVVKKESKKWAILAGLTTAIVAMSAAHTEAAGPVQPDTDPVTVGAPDPAGRLTDVAGLSDGLAVKYFYNRFTHIDEVVEWMKYDEGERGSPLSQIDYQVGQGVVLTSGGTDMVGADIRGYILFADTGTYTFLVTSNDGVRLTIGGVMMHEDPAIHPDTVSPPLVMEVAEPGWYPIEILYYEKKGTATLKLEWQPPGAASFALVPAAALKHADAPAG